MLSVDAVKQTANRISGDQLPQHYCIVILPGLADYWLKLRPAEPWIEAKLGRLMNKHRRHISLLKML